MAALNPRLLPLVETLIGVGADWLAVELIDNVNRGRWPEESEDLLAVTRTQVREGVAQKRERELVHKSVEPVPIPEDEQIDWAAGFIEKRLQWALDDLDSAFVNLDTLLGQAPAQPTAAKRDERSLVVRLGSGDASAKLSRYDIEQARAGMEQLRIALRRWSRDAREASAR